MVIQFVSVILVVLWVICVQIMLTSDIG